MKNLIKVFRADHYSDIEGAINSWLGSKYRDNKEPKIEHISQVYIPSLGSYGDFYVITIIYQI